MGIISRMLKQTGVYWSYNGEASSGPTWDTPVEVPLRWEDMRGDGDVGIREFKAQAYVDRDVRPGDYLMLGNLTSGISNDPRQEQAWEVQSFEKTPNLRAKEFLRLAALAPSHEAMQALGGRSLVAVTYFRILTATVQDDGTLGRTTSQVAIATAYRERVVSSEVERARGRLQTEERIWEIPKFYLLAEPGREDYIEDSDGQWNVTSWTEGETLRSWWRISTKRKLS